MTERALRAARRVAAFSLLTLLASLAGCGPPGDGSGERGSGRIPGAVQLEDSAGVPVVVNPPETPPGRPAWRLAAEPSVRIGVADGPPEYLLHRAFNGAVLSDGTIAVANVGTLEVRYYDPSGRHLRTVGREGEGPGEFRGLSLAGVLSGDSLVLLDSRLRRVTVLGPDGGSARSFPVPEALEGPPRVVGLLADGRLVIGRVGRNPMTPGARVTRSPFFVVVLSPDGASWLTLGPFPGTEGSEVNASGSHVGVGVPFGRDVSYAAGAGRVVVGTDDAFSLRVYDGTGTLTAVIRQVRDPRPVDPEQYELWMNVVQGRAPDPASPLSAMREQAIAQMPRYTTLPAFGPVRIDRAGNLWVREYEPRTEWQVFDPEGRLITHIELPPTLDVLDIGDDYLLGRVTDELGVEQVRRYRLEKG